MHKNRFSVTLVVACALVAMLAMACDTGLYESPEDPAVFGNTLNSLGVDTASVTGAPRVDEFGKALPDDYNPYSASTHALYKTSELSLAGWIANGQTIAAALFDPVTMNPLAVDEELDPAALASCIYKSDSGDLDGDGLEESVLAMFIPETGSVILRRGHKARPDAAFTYKEIAELSVSQAINTQIIDQYRTSVELADLDGDSRDEIILVYGSALTVLDDTKSNYNVLLQESIERLSDISASATQYVRVATGNMDDDPACELVLVNGSDDATKAAVFTIYDDLKAQSSLEPMAGSGTSAPLFLNETRFLNMANVCLGDLNGDRLLEMAFVGPNYDPTKIPLAVARHSVDVTGAHALSLAFLQMWSGIVDPVSWAALPSLTFWNCTTAEGANEDRACLIINANCMEISSSGNDCYTKAVLSQNLVVFDSVKVSDLDGDEIKDIALSQKRPAAAGSTEDYYTVDLYKGSATERYKFVSFQSITVASPLGNSNTGTLCLPATLPPSRKNSAPCLILAARGHDVRFTAPRILAVLASPPYWNGIEQAEGSTTFGKATSQGSTESESYGFSAYASVGFEQEANFLVKLGGAQASTKISAGFDYSSSRSQETTTSLSWSTPAGEDMVVFTCIPYDVYYYEIVQCSDPASVGSIVTVNLPRKPISTSATVEFFNANNGDFPDIGMAILQHSRGNPHSYMSPMTAKQIAGASGFYTPVSGAQTIGQGSGTTTIGREDSATVEESYTGTYAVEVEGEVNVAGATVGAGVEFSGSYSYAYSLTDSTFVEGTVGNILDGAVWANHRFAWGLVSFMHTNAAKVALFPVLTYWTD